jgi:hypothetical protein
LNWGDEYNSNYNYSGNCINAEETERKKRDAEEC